MRLSLTMAGSLIADVATFGRIVAHAESGRVEQNPQDLRIGDGGPARKTIERSEHYESAQETPKEIEGRPSHDERQKKQAALGAPDRERLVDGLVHWMYARFV